MAKKKDFSSIGTERAAQVIQSPEVSGQIANSTTEKRKQTTATPEEIERRKAEGRTQGRKGAHADRLNITFTTDNFKFIKVMARGTGRTMTGFVNYAIEKYRNSHQEDYEAYKEFQEMMDKRLKDQED